MTQVTMKVELNEVFKSNFSIFQDYDLEVKTQQIKLLNYIETIAHQLEKNLTGVNLFDIFKNNNNILMTNEGEINTVLIDFDREKYFGKPDPVRIIHEMTEEQIKSVDELYTRGFNNRKNSIELNIKEYIEYANSNMRDYTNNISSAAKYRESLAELVMGDSTPLIENLKKMFADPRIVFEGFSRTNQANDTLIFNTTHDIINTCINPHANINLRMNLGKLKFKIVIRGGLSMKILSHEGNTNANGYIHPHVSTGGSVCLGNMEELFKEATTKLDIFGMFEAVYMVLTNYNDGDPHHALIRFIEKSGQIQPDGLPRGERNIRRHNNNGEPETRTQEVECHECGHYHEVTFSEDSDYTHGTCPECDTEEEYEYYYGN